jgi:hypothetical protein
MRRAATRKSRLGDHLAALSATAGGVAGSAAFQPIRLKLLRYQNVNAAAPGRPATLQEKSVDEGSLRELGNVAGGFTRVSVDSALPENRSLLKRPRKWLSMSAAACPGARTISLVWRRSGGENPHIGREDRKIGEFVERKVETSAGTHEAQPHA